MWLSFARNASLLATLMLVSTTNFAQDYYKWVDSQGTTHYTKTPPPKSAKNLGKIATQGFHNSAPTKVVEPQPPITQQPTVAQQPPANLAQQVEAATPATPVTPNQPIKEVDTN